MGNFLTQPNQNIDFKLKRNYDKLPESFGHSSLRLYEVMRQQFSDVLAAKKMLEQVLRQHQIDTSAFDHITDAFASSYMSFTTQDPKRMTAFAKDLLSMLHLRQALGDRGSERFVNMIKHEIRKAYWRMSGKSNALNGSLTPLKSVNGNMQNSSILFQKYNGNNVNTRRNNMNVRRSNDSRNNNLNVKKNNSNVRRNNLNVRKSNNSNTKKNNNSNVRKSDSSMSTNNNNTNNILAKLGESNE